VLVFAGGGQWAAVTLAATLALAWEYSAPPLRLCATGTGELTTAIVVTGFVPWLGFYLQAPDLAGARTLFLAIVPLALLQLAMLIAIEIPDAAGDRATGKRTLVVRIGGRNAERLYAAVTAIAFAWLLPAVWLGLPAHVALIAAIPTPFAAWRIARIRPDREQGAFERIAFGAVFLLIVTAVAELVAFA
jgi:1,4-dihydroxy-2-naphthoate polyprenyltransferase